MVTLTEADGFATFDCGDQLKDGAGGGFDT